MVKKLLAALFAWLLGREPIEVSLFGRPAYLDPLSMRVWPAVAGGDGSDEDDDGDEGEGEDEEDADEDPKGDEDDDGDEGDEDDDDDAPKPDDWKRHARKHERRAKRAEARASQLEKELEKLKGKNKTEQEKAIEKARDEAKAEVKAEYEKQRRADRLEAAVARQAVKGVSLTVEEDGKKVAKTVKFADPDDALVHLERGISRGEIDEAEIFDEDGKVDREALASALAELLQDKPHLAARQDGGKPSKAVEGKNDAGKGSPPSDEATDPAAQFKKIRRNKQ